MIDRYEQTSERISDWANAHTVLFNGAFGVTELHFFFEWSTNGDSYDFSFLVRSHTMCKLSRSDAQLHIVLLHTFQFAHAYYLSSSTR